MNIDLNLLTQAKRKNKVLTIGLGKGRGFEELLRLIKIDHGEAYQAFAKGILPVYADEINNLHFVKVRNKDLPWLLAKGHIDVALGSSVWFKEFSHPGLQLVSELPLLKCRLSVIAAKQLPISHITSICSKFQSISKQYIRESKLNANLLIMEGCHEVALSLGMSDAIIDIIETGKTIERMNFVELECIQHITHGLWAKAQDAEEIEKLVVQKKELRIS